MYLPWYSWMECGIEILVAEDDETDRFLISRAFGKTEFGSSMVIARDGQEAVERLQSLGPGTRPKLLLLDLKMPRMDGFAVLEWLSSHPEQRPPLVVVLSSSVDPRDAERSAMLGADLHLTKPHDSREFVRLARELLERLPGRRTAPGVKPNS